MKVIEQTQVNLEYSDLAKRIQHPEPKHQRRPGVHLSAILKYIAVELKLLESKAVDKEDLDEMPLRMILGMAFEREIVGYYPQMGWQPRPLVLDGIHMSPDGEHWMDQEYKVVPEDGYYSPDVKEVRLVIDEFKATYKSSRTRQDITKEWMWMAQVMAYCKGAGTRWGRLHVLWVNGGYDWKVDVPVYMRYLIEFEQTEVDRNWALIRKYMDRVKAEG